MKRVALIVTLCCLLALAAGCTSGWSQSAIDELSPSSVALTLAEGAAPATRAEPVLTLEYQNLTMNEYYFGLEPHLEYLDKSGSWLVVPMKDDAAWEDVACILKPANFAGESVTLNDYYDKLPKGDYRYVKALSDGTDTIYTAYAFTLE